MFLNLVSDWLEASGPFDFGSSSIYTQVEEDCHTHIKNANQVAPAALARAGVCTTGIVASKF